MARVFGEIVGYPPGSTFPSREALRVAGLHPPPIAGISGSETEGADSIVLSGGYEDDRDNGTDITYTGQGGNINGRQVADQEFTRGNRALMVSMTQGLPVRVTRGSQHLSQYSPASGYAYAGLYRVDSHWEKTGTSGYLVHLYRLVAESGQDEPREGATPAGKDQPGRRIGTTSRVIRDTALTRRVKKDYGYQCQVCGIRINGAAGPYAEGAHIRPLGHPHDGPDVASNILCLCPNHHAQFDLGGFTIADDLTLIGIPGQLTVKQDHGIDPAHLQYRRNHYPGHT